MRYSESSHDNKLRNWFKNDVSCTSLQQISLNGSLRGLSNLNIEFGYPISAFSGKNGSGKTTILALAACAYHNNEKGFRYKKNKKTYYTFSDFFVQTNEEVKPEGIKVSYRFLHNNWKGKKPGLGLQSMIKRKGGKWTRYDKRVNKNVIYLGIDRLVPQSEKQVYKSYINIFQDQVENDWHNEVCKKVGRILGKNYSKYKIKKAGNYDLQIVSENLNTYSGFNMGAGEKALFELFTLIYQCSIGGKAVLIIIDEIELGLHESAQKKLIEELKLVCQKFRLQIICTTHSPAILNSLPPDARFYLDKIGEDTNIIKGISADFAAGRLSERDSNELDIYVEDSFAKSLIVSLFNHEMRKRINVIPIGSFNAVLTQLASAYRHPILINKSLAILDGDQRSGIISHINKVQNDLALTTDSAITKYRLWVKDKIHFLPGKLPPEKWIIQKSIEYSNSELADKFDITKGELINILNLANNQESHEEFYFIAENLALDIDFVISNLCRHVVKNDKSSFENIINAISEYLD